MICVCLSVFPPFSDSSKEPADSPGVALQAEQAGHTVALPAPQPPASSAGQERGQRSAA